MSAKLKTQTPPDGDWISTTNRVAAIYGANASGKSTVLDAIRFLRDSIAWSAREDRKSATKFPGRRFSLDKESRKRPSLYEIDFVMDGVRYVYGFETRAGTVIEEYLYTYPSGKRRTLFERGEEIDDVYFGRELKGPNAALARLCDSGTLFLSLANAVGHESLRSVRDYIVDSLLFGKLADSKDATGVSALRKVLVEDEQLRKRVEALLRAADLGITGIRINKSELSDEDVEKLTALHGSLETFTEGRIGSLEALLEDAEYSLTLEHATDDEGKPRSFPLARESDGTVAWLSIAIPALDAISSGKTLLVDEVGANLHPVLTRELIKIFKDPDLNSSGGQLVFTTHDTPLIGSLLGDALSRDEVWFTEKLSDGAARLYSLEEFSVRAETNFEKRYLEGRFGAIPQVEDGELRSVLREMRQDSLQAAAE